MARFQLPAEVRVRAPSSNGPPPTEVYKEQYRAQTRELLAKLVAEFPSLAEARHREEYYEKTLRMIAFLTEHGASSLAVEVNAIAQTAINRAAIGKKSKN